MMNEVGGKLLSIFATNLAALLASIDDAPAPTDGAEASDAAAGQASEAAGQASEAALDDLKLPTRSVASLRREGIIKIEQLAAKTDDELLAIDGIGPASVDQIKAKLAELGLAPGQPAATAAAVPAAADRAVTDRVPPATPAANGSLSSATNGSAGSTKAGANGTRTGTTATAPRSQSSVTVPVHQDEALNLIKVAGMPVLKRSLPVLAGVTAVLIIGWRRRTHRRNR